MKRILKFISIVTCCVVVFNFVMTPVMAKSDPVYFDKTVDRYDVFNPYEISMSDNLSMKDGYVSIRTYIDGGLDLNYYDNKNKLKKSNYLDSLYLLDGITVDDCLYLLLFSEPGSSRLASGPDITPLYLYKIDSNMNEVDHVLISERFAFFSFDSYINIKILGNNLINYINNEIVFYGVSLVDTSSGYKPSANIYKYDTNLNISGKIDLENYVDDESIERLYSLIKKYFPSLELYLRYMDKRDEMNDYIDNCIPNDINKIYYGLYPSNLVTGKNIISVGSFYDYRGLSGDYDYVAEDGSIEYDEDKLNEDIDNNLREVGALRIADTNGNVILEKEMADCTAIISPKISNNHIVAIGLNETDDSSSILIFDMNGNLIKKIDYDGFVTAVQETEEGFVTIGISSDSESCRNRATTPDNHSFPFESAGKSYFDGDSTVPRLFEKLNGVIEHDIPGVVFQEDLQESGSFCATCSVNVYKFNSSLRISNPKTSGNTHALIIVSLILMSALCLFVINKKIDNC